MRTPDDTPLSLPRGAARQGRALAARIALLAGLLAPSGAAAQSGEWEDWTEARYYWDLDREELDTERDRNAQVRGQLGLVALELQTEEASLTPPPRAQGAARPIIVAPDPVQIDAAQIDPEPPRQLSAAERRAEDARARKEAAQARAEEARLRKQEARSSAEDSRRLKTEEARRLEERERAQAQEDERARLEDERRRREDEARAASEARRREAEAAKIAEEKEKAEAEEERKKKEAELARRKLLEKKLLDEKKNERGQVVDDELNELLEEGLE